MKTLEVKFDDTEKQIIHDYIVANALEESRCRDDKGYEFEFTNDCFPQFKNMTLYVSVQLFEKCDKSLPPEPPTVVERGVMKFSYEFIDQGDEVRTNLDANFEDKVINSLTI